MADRDTRPHGDDITRMIDADAAALRSASHQAMPSIEQTAALAGTPTTSGHRHTPLNPLRLATAGALAALALLAIGAVASPRFRHLLVNIRGRQAATIEKDLRDQLEGEGFRDARVTVDKQPGDVRINVDARDSNGAELATEHRVSTTGPEVDAPVVIELPDFSDLEHLPLPERRLAIEKRLAERGIKATVTIENGHLRIDADDRRIGKERP